MVRFPGLDSYVTMHEESHTYWDKDGRQYESVSKFLSRFYEAFDAQLISRQVAKSTGEDAGVIEAEWKRYGQERADEGTRVHNAMELFEKECKILPENEDCRPWILSVASEYKDYYKCYQEQCLYDTDNLLAGTSDKLCLFSSHAKSVVDIADYKNYVNGLPQINISKKGERVHKYMLGPLSHLIDSKFNKVALQLSVYAYMLEKKTGRRIGKLFIHCIPPNDPLGHYMVPMMYMKYEVESMLLHKKITDGN